MLCNIDAGTVIAMQIPKTACAIARGYTFLDRMNTRHAVNPQISVNGVKTGFGRCNNANIMAVINAARFAFGRIRRTRARKYP